MAVTASSRTRDPETSLLDTHSFAALAAVDLKRARHSYSSASLVLVCLQRGVESSVGRALVDLASVWLPDRASAAGRWRPREFALLVVDVDPAAADAVTHRLRDAGQDRVAHVGVAHWDGAESVASLLERAARGVDAAPRAR